MAKTCGRKPQSAYVARAWRRVFQRGEHPYSGKKLRGHADAAARGANATCHTRIRSSLIADKMRRRLTGKHAPWAAALRGIPTAIPLSDDPALQCELCDDGNIANANGWGHMDEAVMDNNMQDLFAETVAAEATERDLMHESEASSSRKRNRTGKEDPGKVLDSQPPADHAPTDVSISAAPVVMESAMIETKPMAVVPPAQRVRSAAKKVEALRKKEAERIRELKLQKPALRQKPGPGISSIRAKFATAMPELESAQEANAVQIARDKLTAEANARKRAPTPGQTVKIASSKLQALRKRALMNPKPTRMKRRSTAGAFVKLTPCAESRLWLLAWSAQRLTVPNVPRRPSTARSSGRSDQTRHQRDGHWTGIRDIPESQRQDTPHLREKG